jgi:hypothetical protein
MNNKQIRNILVLAAASILLFVTTSLRAEDQPASPAPAPEKLKTLPPGNHRLLENMTKRFGLTMDQELEIEPLLHDEESVSKPILGFAAFTPEEQKAMLLTVKLAARRQIRPLLTAEQQVKLDEETAGLSQKSAKGAGAGGKGKKAAATTEEAVTKTILAYLALTDAEKQSMIAKVKAAAQRPSATPEQPVAKPGEVSPAEPK